MAKIIFEGTEEQIQTLKTLLSFSDRDLPTDRTDHYQTYNLWCVDDVKGKFDCDDDEAMEVLEDALTNEATMGQIWYAIDFHGEEMGLTRKVDED